MLPAFLIQISDLLLLIKVWKCFQENFQLHLMFRDDQLPA